MLGSACCGVHAVHAVERGLCMLGSARFAVSQAVQLPASLRASKPSNKLKPQFERIHTAKGMLCGRQ